MERHPRTGVRYTVGLTFHATGAHSSCPAVRTPEAVAGHTQAFGEPAEHNGDGDERGLHSEPPDRPEPTADVVEEGQQGSDEI